MKLRMKARDFLSFLVLLFSRVLLGRLKSRSSRVLVLEMTRVHSWLMSSREENFLTFIPVSNVTTEREMSRSDMKRDLLLNFSLPFFQDVIWEASKWNVLLTFFPFNWRVSWIKNIISDGIVNGIVKWLPSQSSLLSLAIQFFSSFLSVFSFRSWK